MKALDYLGGWKWPSVALVALVPLGSYFLLDWDGFADPVAEAVLGPEVVAGRPVILSRPVAEAGHDWCARSCPVCWNGARTVELAYGRAAGPERWTKAAASRGRLCASLDPPAPGATHIWMRVSEAAGEGARAFPLDAAVPAQLE